MERREVEMIRIERQEEVFATEDVFGRDAASVFPNEAKKAKAASNEKILEVLGAKKFVTESELAAIKNARGLSVEDGTLNADKSLSEVLAERKAAKEAAFQEQWKQLKTGKNRPLDEDELRFLDTFREEGNAKERAAMQEEKAQLEAFRLARLAAEAEASTTEAQAGPTALGPQLPAAAAPHNGNKKPAPAKPAIKPTIKVKAKAPAAAAGVVTAGAAAIAASSSGREGGAQAPDAKRQKLEEGGNKGVKAAAKAGGSGAAAAPVPAPSLAGLLGGYGSDSDDGSGSGSD